MKKIIYLFIVSISALGGQAQTSEVEQSHIAFQRASKMNILYIGVENPIEIIAPNVADSNLSVRFNGTGKIKKLDKDHYIITVFKQDVKSYIEIYDGTTLIDRQRYTCRYVPDPILTIGGKYKGGEISTGKLKAQNGVVGVLDNFDFEVRFFTQSFTMTYESKGELFKVENKGPIFSEQIQSIFSRILPGDIIIIGDIIVRGPDGATRKLPPIAFGVI